MLEQGAFYLSLFIFGMFFVYLIAEAIHIVVIKDTDSIKKVLLYIVAAVINIATLYAILKMPRCQWCEDHPYIHGTIFIAVVWGLMLLPILLPKKRRNKTNRQIWR